MNVSTKHGTSIRAPGHGRVRTIAFVDVGAGVPFPIIVIIVEVARVARACEGTGGVFALRVVLVAGVGGFLCDRGARPVSSSVAPRAGKPRQPC